MTTIMMKKRLLISFLTRKRESKNIIDKDGFRQKKKGKRAVLFLFFKNDSFFL